MPRFKIKYNDDAIFFSPLTKKRQNAKRAQKVDKTPLSALLFSSGEQVMQQECQKEGKVQRSSLDEEIVLDGNSAKTPKLAFHKTQRYASANELDEEQLEGHEDDHVMFCSPLASTMTMSDSNCPSTKISGRSPQNDLFHMKKSSKNLLKLHYGIDSAKSDLLK